METDGRSLQFQVRLGYQFRDPGLLFGAPIAPLVARTEHGAVGPACQAPGRAL